MAHDVHQVRKFEHPGEGRKRAKATPKGRQVDPTAAHEIEHLLGDRPRRRDLLIEHLHLIQDKYQPDLGGASRGACRRDEAVVRRGVRDRDLLCAFRRREGRRARHPAADHPRLRFSLTCAMLGGEKLLRESAERGRARRARRARALRRPLRQRAGGRGRPPLRRSCHRRERARGREGRRHPSRICPTTSTTTPMSPPAATSCSSACARASCRRRIAEGARRRQRCAASAARASRPGANGARCSASPARG